MYREFSQKEFDYLLKLYGDNLDRFCSHLGPLYKERLEMYRCSLCWTRVAKLSKVTSTRIRQVMNKVHHTLDRPVNLRKLIDLKIKNRDSNKDIKEVVEYYEEMRRTKEPTGAE